MSSRSALLIVLRDLSQSFQKSFQTILAIEIIKSNSTPFWAITRVGRWYDDHVAVSLKIKSAPYLKTTDQCF